MVFQEFGKVHALSSTSIHFLLFSLSNQNKKKRRSSFRSPVPPHPVIVTEMKFYRDSRDSLVIPGDVPGILSLGVRSFSKSPYPPYLPPRHPWDFPRYCGTTQDLSSHPAPGSWQFHWVFSTKTATERSLGFTENLENGNPLKSLVQVS